VRRVTTIFFVFAAVILLFGCHKETEQDKIKKVITDIQSAVEGKDIKNILNNVSKTYNDPQGSDYETIRRLLLGYFFRYPKISVYINNLDISVEDNTSARAMFQAVLTSGKKTGSVSDIIPESLGMYYFDVSLTKESNEWKVTSATWTQAEPV
jgi:hypothetical protein